MIEIKPAVLSDYTAAILRGAGATEPIAERMADALVGANLAGHDSHGVIRIPQYLRDIEHGSVDPKAQPEVSKQGPAWTLVDGRWAFGQETAGYAMQQAIDRAYESGIALATAMHCNHIGRVGQWVEQAAAQRMMGIAGVGITGPAARVAPFGGATGALSTNPLAISAPRAEGPPLLLDFASSNVAEGKVRVAREKGVQLPEGCILDKEGHPTNDPNALYEGGVMLPMGGHKGYALAMMIEVLGVALSGADDAAGPAQGRSIHGAFFMSINPAVFRPYDRFAQSVEQLAERVSAIPPAQGFKEVLLPGDPENRARSERAEEISLAPLTWEEIVKAGESVGVKAPF